MFLPSRPLLFVVLLLVSYQFFDNFMFSVPVRLLENAVCQRHYASLQRHLDELQCKTPTIQSTLAYIRGYYSLFRTGPAIFVGPYFGHLADQWGRRPVYSIILLGLMLQLASFYLVCSWWNIFPSEASWITGIFTTLGGGQFVLVSLNLTMVSDVSAPNNRDRHLYFAFAVRYFAALIGPYVASAALEHSLWLPTLLAMLCLLISLLVIVVMQEPLNVLGENHSSSVDINGTDQGATSILKPLSTRWPVLVCICINFCLQFRMIVQAILLTYISFRFKWTISQVTRLMSIQPAVSLILFLTLPAMMSATSHASSKQKRGFRIFRALMLLLVFGYVILAAASNIVLVAVGLTVSAFGDGIRAPLLVIASGYVDHDTQTARLYTWFAFTDALSHTLGDPFLQAIWQLGLYLQGKWLILPILVTLLFIALGYGMSIALPKVSEDTATTQEERTQASRSLLSINEENINGEDLSSYGTED